jgi:Raf kinase inhibitor-like YbhB/YbcL family protein
MSDTVADSSVVAKWVLPEPDSGQAQRLISEVVLRGHRLIVLDLALVEVANAIWKQYYRKVATLAEARHFLNELLRSPVHIEPAQRLLPAALEIAAKYGRAVYDALFIALAQDQALFGVTADEPLYQAVHADFPQIVLLRNWKPEALLMQVTSTAFKEGDTIPRDYTGDGKNVSPPLSWTGAPDDTRSFALICDDPDAPRGPWVHWVFFNLPPDLHALVEATARDVHPGGAIQGTNDFKKVGYDGPSPPPGKPHRYYFRVYALGKLLELPPGATRQQVVAAMEGHILASGQLMGRYGR